MLFSLEAGYTLRFLGLELVNHYDTVGPTFRPMRQSIGATLVIEDCVQRRRAGLPYEAAVVNMLAGARPAGMGSSQVCNSVSSFTFRTTRSPTPVTYTPAVSMFDYATLVTPDSSLAFQGLYYGGYIHIATRSYYVVDNFVSQSCLDQRPGTECVALLLQQLAQEAAAPPAASGNAPASSSNAPTIIAATVVPVSAVVIAAAVATAVLMRRRNSGSGYVTRGSARCGGDPGGRATVPSVAVAVNGEDSGCVFWGVDEGQALPTWTMDGAAEDEVDDVDDFDADKITQDQVDVDDLKPPVSPPHQQRTSEWSRHGDASAHGASGRLRPALSLQLERSVRPGGSGAGGEHASAGRPNIPIASGAAQGGTNKQASADTGRVSSGATARSAAPPPDLLAELGRMAAELRATVRDEVIKLESVIGCGSFGTVYKGAWQGLPVAVKTLVFTATNESRRRALQEAALCQSISHPNVVATYASELQPLGPLTSATAASGSAETLAGGANTMVTEREMSRALEWRLYIVQEYADAGPLRRLFGDKGLWPRPGEVNMPAVVSLALGISRALTHLHSKRIIHGDLNPNNVLLKRDSTEPSGYCVKVGDFGLSVMLPEHRTHLSNLRMGTMFYMCPAVVMKGHVGPASDVFSLGVMLWELYHGRRAGTRTEQGPRYCSVFPAFPPSCPPAYSAVALHCLQRQPVNRPPAADVEARLEALLRSLQSARGAGELVPVSGSSINISVGPEVGLPPA